MGKRVIIGSLLILALAGFIVLDCALRTRVALSALITLCGILGWYELSVMGRIHSRAQGGGAALFLVGLLGTLYFLVVGWWSGVQKAEDPVLLTAGFAGLVFLAFTAVLFREDFKEAFQPLLLDILGVLFCGFLFSFVLRIYQRDDGTALGILFLLGVKGNDVFGYFVGSTLGRRRFLKVSPRKTLEGCLGALIFSTSWFTGLAIFVPEGFFFPWPWPVLLGIILSVTSQMGDLSESLVKRYCGVKDSGVFLPAFGGVLDLIDSLLYSGFTFWFFLEVFKR